MCVKKGSLMFGTVIQALLLPVVACVLCQINVNGNETKADKDKIVARFLSREISDCTTKLDGKLILDVAQTKVKTNNVTDGIVMLPFATKPAMRRVCINMDVELDLGQYSDFTLNLKGKRILSDLDGRITLYFRSATNQWHRLNPILGYTDKDGSVRIRYNVPDSRPVKKDFHKIEEIQIAFWNLENPGDKPVGMDMSVQVGKLLAFTKEEMSQPGVLFCRQCRNILEIGCSLPEEAENCRTANAGKTVDELLKRGWTCQSLANIFDSMLAKKEVVSDKEKELLARFTSDIRAIRTVLVADYINSREQSSPQSKPEMRLVWEHPGDKNYGGDWDKKISELVAAGFNGIIVRVQTGGEACYDSDILPQDIAVKTSGYHLDAIMKAAKKHGIDVHAWKVCYQCRNTNTDFVRKMRQEGRLQKSFDGKGLYDRDGQRMALLCPSHPGNRKVIVDSFVEMATKYPDLKGIHYDYIRYETAAYCYCEGCRDRFNSYYKERTGKTVKKWPQDTRYNPDVKKYFIPWRAQQVTMLVRDVRNTFREKFPKMQVSAAVQQSWPYAIETMGQDWIAWGKEGLIDFVCPMTYFGYMETFQQANRFLFEQMGGAIPVYPGIAMSQRPLAEEIKTLDKVYRQIEFARELGTGGFAIFSYSQDMRDEFIPILKQTNFSKQVPTENK